MFTGKIEEIISGLIDNQLDVSWDFQNMSSLKQLQIIMALDAEGISIPIEKIGSIHSVEDIKRMLNGSR